MPNDGTQTWPELAVELYDKLTGRNAEITYEFEDMEGSVPSAAAEQTAHAPWKVNGVLKIRARELEAA